MDMIKYIARRILIALVILLGVSVIIYGLARMMPNDYIDQQYASALAQGTMRQEDVDRIKELYGLSMPDAYLKIKVENESSEFNGKTFERNVRRTDYEDLGVGISRAKWYTGTYDAGNYRLELLSEEVEINGAPVDRPTIYNIYHVQKGSVNYGDQSDDSSNITIGEILTLKESGYYTIDENTGSLCLFSSKPDSLEAVSPLGKASVIYRNASFWDKTGAILKGYFTWLTNMLKGDLGISFKYKKPVGEVIVQNMGISFGIMLIATILQFAIAIPLGIKAATNQYGVIDYTVTVLTMIGISLPTFFLGALFIRVFAVQLGWFPVGGLMSSLPVGASGWTVFVDVLHHLIMPMVVLVILSVGSLMRYTRTNMLEVLNADYIRTARAKGLSEKTVIYKHAFRNTMIPLVTLMASILPSLFGGAMITETVFGIPGIGKLAYDALIVADVPFIMGYNMFLAILTVVGTLLSDLMYAVVDPRVKLDK